MSITRVKYWTRIETLVVSQQQQKTGKRVTVWFTLHCCTSRDWTVMCVFVHSSYTNGARQTVVYSGGNLGLKMECIVCLTNFIGVNFNAHPIIKTIIIKSVIFYIVYQNLRISLHLYKYSNKKNIFYWY